MPMPTLYFSLLPRCSQRIARVPYLQCETRLGYFCFVEHARAVIGEWKYSAICNTSDTFCASLFDTRNTPNKSHSDLFVFWALILYCAILVWLAIEKSISQERTVGPRAHQLNVHLYSINLLETKLDYSFSFHLLGVGKIFKTFNRVGMAGAGTRAWPVVYTCKNASCQKDHASVRSTCPSITADTSTMPIGYRAEKIL